MKNTNLSVTLEQLKADKIRFEHKAKFYEALYQKIQNIEKIYDDTPEIPIVKWEKFYQLRRIVAHRCDKYEKITFELSTYVEALEYIQQDIEDLYKNINR